MAALTPLVQRCGELDAQAVGNALYGLQRMTDSREEVLRLLAALTPKVERCDGLDAQAVGNALYGLRCMGDTKVEEVIDFY